MCICSLSSTHEKWYQKQKCCIYLFVQCRSAIQLSKPASLEHDRTTFYSSFSQNLYIEVHFDSGWVTWVSVFDVVKPETPNALQKHQEHCVPSAFIDVSIQHILTKRELRVIFISVTGITKFSSKDKKDQNLKKKNHFCI